MLVSSSTDSLLAGPPDATTAPELMLAAANNYGGTVVEGFSWLPDGRLVATAWNANSVVATRIGQRPIAFDTLATSAVLGRASPDGHWLAYNGPGFNETWVEPIPRTGRRFPAGNGNFPQWLNATEFAVVRDGGRLARIKVEGPASAPKITGAHWFDVPRFVGIPSGGFSLTPDGRVIYKQGADVQPARYLRVIPNWVEGMKAAVDKANR